MFIKLESVYEKEFAINTNKVIKVIEGNPGTSGGTYEGRFCMLSLESGEYEYVKGNLDEVTSKLEGNI